MSDIKLPKMVGEIDGTPRMSDNCWDAIVTQVKASQSPCRLLEWGSGNSTLCLIRMAIEQNLLLDFVSIEHDLAFFCTILCEILRYVKTACVHGTFTFQQIQRFAMPTVRRARQEIATFENHFIFWQYLTGNRDFKHSHRLHPNFQVPLSRVVKRLAAFSVGRTQFYAQCAASGHGEHLWHPRQQVTLGEAEMPEVNQLTTGVSVEIRLPMINFSYMYLVPQKNPLTGRWTFDGLFSEFYQYVMAPLPHDTYDVIVVDGRARASCIKRVFHEQLLSDQGTLFVHDASTDAFYEAFQLFGNEYTFLDGSNHTLKGDLTHPERGLPVVCIGMDLRHLAKRNSREMWVYRKSASASVSQEVRQ